MNVLNATHEDNWIGLLEIGNKGNVEFTSVWKSIVILQLPRVIPRWVNGCWLLLFYLLLALHIATLLRKHGRRRRVMEQEHARILRGYEMQSELRFTFIFLQQTVVSIFIVNEMLKPMTNTHIAVLLMTFGRERINRIFHLLRSILYRDAKGTTRLRNKMLSNRIPSEWMKSIILMWMMKRYMHMEETQEDGNHNTKFGHRFMGTTITRILVRRTLFKPLFRFLHDLTEWGRTLGYLFTHRWRAWHDMFVYVAIAENRLPL